VINEFLATVKYPCAPSDIQTKLANHGVANDTYANMATAEIDEEFLVGLRNYVINISFKNSLLYCFYRMPVIADKEVLKA